MPASTPTCTRPRSLVQALQNVVAGAVERDPSLGAEDYANTFLWESPFDSPDEVEEDYAEVFVAC